MKEHNVNQKRSLNEKIKTLIENLEDEFLSCNDIVAQGQIRAEISRVESLDKLIRETVLELKERIDDLEFTVDAQRTIDEIFGEKLSK